MVKHFSHIDKSGRAVMVDVSPKKVQYRKAIAQGSITLKPETIRLIQQQSLSKGEVLTVAQIAGIQAAKRTSELIPLCHPLNLGKVDLFTEMGAKSIRVKSEVTCVGQTGVEMEALTAVSVALLTIYDMCKAVDQTMVIGDIHLLEKTKEDQKL